MEIQGADQWALVLRRLQQETRRNAIDAVTYAGVKIAVSGRKMAAPGAKRRKVERNTDFRRMVRDRRKWAKARGTDTSGFAAKNVFPWFIKAYRQRGEPAKIGTWKPQTDPRRDIEEYGLARKMWNILWGQLASLKGQGNVSMQGGNGTAVVKRSIRANATRYSVSLDLSVRLNYLEKAYPGIGATAVAKGQSAVLHELDNRMQRTLAKYGQG